jgi:phosphatidylserine/phosphatidylglycerophosphate/cardiolipin synthase-like enzyme
MRAARLAVVVPLLSLLAPLAVVSPPAAGASAASAQASSSISAAADGDEKAGEKVDGRDAVETSRRRKNRWAPPSGVLLSNPMTAQRRNILARVIRSIRNTAKKEYIRVVVWNYDDRPVTDALLAADRRGVHVQVVVAGSVENANWARTRKQLNRKRGDKSFAVKCTGGCRSRTKIMHSKYVLFSRVHRAKNISMFGSFNLTTPAGNRQWNDMVTTRHRGLYKSLARTFREYANDAILPGPYQVTDAGRYRVTLFPAFGKNPIADEIRKIKCRGATGGAGNAKGRTVIRIAIAGWFDAFGTDIARPLRALWDRGCDIRIITTLAGRGVNQTLKKPTGRGPVPIRKLTVDNNLDGIPERYLHMKNIAISGVYDGDRSANVLLTGSPNWSTRAQRSDEILFRIKNSTRIVRQYQRHIDRLFFGPWSHTRTTQQPKLLGRGFAVNNEIPNLKTGKNVPDWFELD